MRRTSSLSSVPGRFPRSRRQHVLRAAAGRASRLAAAGGSTRPRGSAPPTGCRGQRDRLPCRGGGRRVAGVPTPLWGAGLTGSHRLPDGVEGVRLVRPSLVIADPALMASAPLPLLAATALNALAHAVEALYTPLANPVANMAALRGASLIASGLRGEGDPSPPAREELALGALLAAYASGQTGYAVHHVVCQTIVRLGGTPHAETNAT